MRDPRSVIVVREWDADSFHRQMLGFETEGYIARRDSYEITPEVNPETGEIIHLHSIELSKPQSRPGLRLQAEPSPPRPNKTGRCCGGSSL